jgi:hypothetical protein
MAVLASRPACAHIVAGLGSAPEKALKTGGSSLPRVSVCGGLCSSNGVHGADLRLLHLFCHVKQISRTQPPPWESNIDKTRHYHNRHKLSESRHSRLQSSLLASDPECPVWLPGYCIPRLISSGGNQSPDHYDDENDARSSQDGKHYSPGFSPACLDGLHLAKGYLPILDLGGFGVLEDDSFV